jgi:hypothetical protein
MLKRLFRSRKWTVIYAETGADDMGNARNIPRWLRSRVLNLRRIPEDEYYEFRGRHYEYRVSFTANHGHGRVVARRLR